MQTSALNEPRRRAYLQALGLDLVRARSPLPGAAPSVAWSASALAVESSPSRDVTSPLPPTAMLPKPSVALTALSAVATASPVTHSPASPLPAAAQAAREALRGGQAARPLSSVVVPAHAVPSAASLEGPHDASLIIALPVARFSLLLVPITATHIALIDLDNQPALEGSEARLWAAICAAYGWRQQSLELPVQFNWPIPGLAATPAAAQDALAGWLHTQQTELMAYVVFGENISAVIAKQHLALSGLRILVAEPLAKRELMLKLHT
ncbi:MAG: hypothetical protein ABIR53_04085, partial [Paraperlucidibaca sp.]